MPDLIQVADDLKNMPDQWLAQQAQQPTGEAPPYLVVAELARRERMRSGAEKAKAPHSSVSEDLIRSLYARIPPTTGLAAPGAGAPSGATAPPGMPPPNLSPGNQSMGPPAPGTPPANMRMPKAMAYGGTVDDDDDGSDDDEEERKKREREQAAALYNLPTARPNMAQFAPPATMASPGAPAPAQKPAAGLSSVPGFAPPATFDPGAAGKDVYGRNLPVPKPRELPPDARDLYNEKERTYQLATKEPEDQRDAAHIAKMRDYLTALYGKEPDTKDLQKEMDYLRQKAQEDAPTVSRMLMRFGAALMANPSQHFGQALGEANQQSLNWVDQQRQQQRQMELTAYKVAAEKAQREQAFKLKIASEVAQGTDAAERRAQAQQQRYQTQYTHALDSYNRGTTAWQKQNEADQKDVQTRYINSLNHHLDHNTAIGALQSTDPQVVTYARDFLTNEQMQRAAEERRKLNEQTAAQATARAATNAEWNRRHDILRGDKAEDTAAKPKPGQAKVKTSWTDTDTTSDARGFIDEQLSHIKPNPNGEGFVDENGKPIYKVDASAAKDQDENLAKNKIDILNVAKKRAAEVVRNEQYFTDFPRFKINPLERQRVANRITSVPVKDKEVTVGAQYGKPRGFGSSGAQPQQQPDQSKPSPATPEQKIKVSPLTEPAPPKELDSMPAGYKHQDSNGYWWWKHRDGRVEYLGRE